MAPVPALGRCPCSGRCERDDDIWVGRLPHHFSTFPKYNGSRLIRSQRAMALFVFCLWRFAHPPSPILILPLRRVFIMPRSSIGDP